MNLNLDILKTEIREFLEQEGFVTYFGYSRILDELPMVMWDSGRYPDFKMFLKAAGAAGVKLIVLHSREFSYEFVDRAIDQLDEADLIPEERRSIERRLREMRAYDGFTCMIELSFDLQHRAYIFELRTDWYNEFSNLLNDIEASEDEEDDDISGEGRLGGYFSKN